MERVLRHGKPELIEAIRTAMEAAPERAIPFHDYMELCLYHPMYGYYMDQQMKLGKEGDFYTAASIGSLLAETVAEWMRREPCWAKAPKSPIRIAEWGGGSGKFAAQLLDALRDTAPDLYEGLEYISFEASGYHRSLQAEALAAHAAKVRFLSAEAWCSLGPWRETLVLSNELPDAFPVHRIAARRGGWMETFVRWDDAKGEFAELELPLTNEAVTAYIRDEAIPYREGQQFEINLAAARWINTIAGALAQGVVLTIDYGDTADELYAPHRMNGTLMCYRKHEASDTPLRYPGEQDITSHVNFSALIRAGEAAGLTGARLMSQKQFLVENGLLAKLQDHDASDPFSPAAKRNRAIRQLLLSDQMSELFKVLIQKKEEPLPKA